MRIPVKFIGQTPKAQPCMYCRMCQAAIDHIYERVIVYGLDREFILDMQHLSRVAMLPEELPV